jgi:hypothetical protein
MDIDELIVVCPPLASLILGKQVELPGEIDEVHAWLVAQIRILQAEKDARRHA